MFYRRIEHDGFSLGHVRVGLGNFYAKRQQLLAQCWRL
jgi:hypothetical protein